MKAPSAKKSYDRERRRRRKREERGEVYKRGVSLGKNSASKGQIAFRPREKRLGKGRKRVRLRVCMSECGRCYSAFSNIYRKRIYHWKTGKGREVAEKMSSLGFGGEGWWSTCQFMRRRRPARQKQGSHDSEKIAVPLLNRDMYTDHVQLIWEKLNKGIFILIHYRQFFKKTHKFLEISQKEIKISPKTRDRMSLDPAYLERSQPNRAQFYQKSMLKIQSTAGSSANVLVCSSWIREPIERSLKTWRHVAKIFFRKCGHDDPTSTKTNKLKLLPSACQQSIVCVSHLFSVTLSMMLLCIRLFAGTDGK